MGVRAANGVLRKAQLQVTGGSIVISVTCASVMIPGKDISRNCWAEHVKVCRDRKILMFCRGGAYCLT